MIRFRADTAEAERRLRVVKAAVEGEGGTRVTSRVAYWTLSELVRSTPKKWTGQTRRSWKIDAITRGHRVSNENKVMLFLEEGTRAHGARGGGLLFIPLNRKAAMGGSGLVFGRDYILTRTVRGITPRHIVRGQRGRTEAKLYADMRTFIREVINQ